MINFQSFNSYLAEGLTCTSYSFAINLGVYFKCIPNQIKNNSLKVRSNIICPDECACHIRRPLSKTLQQDFLRKDIWSIDINGGNIDIVIADAVKVIISNAFSWFDRFEDIEEVIRMLLNDEEDLDGTWGFGGKSSPIRNYFLGYISLAIGDFVLAASSLKKVVNFEHFKSDQLTDDYKCALLHRMTSKK